MIYIYKNGERIKIGRNVSVFIYLDEDGNVVAKSVEKLQGYAQEIQVDGDLYGQIIAESGGKSYCHKLKDGANGKSIGDYEKIYDLDFLKSQKCIQIDQKTQDLIAEGIAFDGNVFSASAEAQRNWIATYTARTVLSYPFPVTTIDNNEYNFSDAEKVSQFYLTGISLISERMAYGRNLKLKVMACQTKEEIDAITDPR